MKATIDARGKLTIKAENDLEHYALAHWWEDWQNHKALLNIEIAHEGNPGALTFKQVNPDVP